MTTLTYEDLLNIKAALLDRQEMAATLARIEQMLGDLAHKDGQPNAVSRAAIAEAKNWRSLPAYKTAKEALASAGDDED